MLIELTHITKRYDGNPLPVLDDLSLKIAEGSSVAVAGPPVRQKHSS